MRLVRNCLGLGDTYIRPMTDQANPNSRSPGGIQIQVTGIHGFLGLVAVTLQC